MAIFLKEHPLETTLFPRECSRAIVLLFTLFFLSFSPQCALTEDRPKFQGIRYNDSIEYYKDPAHRENFWDAIKYIPLSSNPTAYLSFGGDIRPVYEIFNNPLWGDGPHDPNGYYLERYTLLGDLHLGDSFRVFTELKYGNEHGRAGGPRIVDVDELDINQAFVDVGGDSSFPITFRIGREELDYGAGRIIGIRQTSNARFSYDGIKIISVYKGVRVESILVSPVQIKPASFNDVRNDDQLMWGSYGMYKKENVSTDVYYLGFRNNGGRYQQGTGDDLRHTFGSRVVLKNSSVSVEGEAALQLGSFQGTRVEAGMASLGTVYQNSSFGFPLAFSLRGDLFSGGSGKVVHTFRSYYPRGTLNGTASIIGFSNNLDLVPSAEIKLPHGVTLRADLFWFWRANSGEGIYDNNENLLRAGDSTQSKYIGFQPQLQAVYEVVPHWVTTLTYSRFEPGSFIKESGAHLPIDYGRVEVRYLF